MRASHLLALLSGAPAAALADSPLLADFRFEGGGSRAEHRRFGAAMGAAYRAAIQQRMSSQIGAFTDLLASAEGQQVYGEFLATHRRLVPLLVEELEGIAEGSNVSFETVFTVNLAQEMGHYAAVPARFPDHCSTYSLCTAARCVGGHNEDDGAEDLGMMFVAHVRIGDSNFTAFNFAGDLPSGSSGFNHHGLAFSLNKVFPPHCDTTKLGRAFVSRLLLDAGSWEEALTTAGMEHAMGHNYNLFDFRARRIANVENANGVYSVRPVTAPFYHANKYQVLQVPGQVTTNSTAHRLARVQRLPIPATSDDVLRVLGDQEDHDWPIFHDGASHARGDLSGWTIETVLFDLDRGVIEFMDGNPAGLKVKRTLVV